MSQGYPDNETDAQRVGTANHALGARCIENNESPLTAELTEIEGVQITPEMREATKVYVDYVNRRSRLYAHRAIERRLTSIRDDIDFGGTADCVLFDFDRIEIADAKFGRIPVEVLGNKQLLCYAVLAVEEYFKTHPPKRIRLTVVQPTAYHKLGPIRTQEIGMSELVEFVARKNKAIKLAESKTKLTLVPGDHCKYCPALAECPAMRNYVQQITGASLGD